MCMPQHSFRPFSLDKRCNRGPISTLHVHDAPSWEDLQALLPAPPNLEAGADLPPGRKKTCEHRLGYGLNISGTPAEF